MEVLVALDAGTGSGRCVVFDLAGRVVARAQEPFHYEVEPDPQIPFVRCFAFDPGEFWATLCRCVRSALAELAPGTVVRAVAATSQREGCVFLDADGRELYAGPNLDARGLADGMEVQERIGPARLHSITGHAPPFIFPLARLLWYRRCHPDRRVARMLMINDWITYRLCGEAGAEPSNASESMLFDVSARRWSEELLDAFEIPRTILPQLRPAGTRVGSVGGRAAAETGLPAGTPVFAGGADTECALLGSGAWRAGDTAAVLGTTAPVQMVTAAPVLDPAGNLWTSCHVVEDRWVIESNAGDTGGAYTWLLEIVGAGREGDPYEVAERWVEGAARAPDALPVLAHVGPSIFNLSSMNRFQGAGFIFRFPLLQVDRPTRADLVRGYLESVAFAVRGNLEQIAEVVGQQPAVLALSGGMCRSEYLVRLMATVSGLPVDVSEVRESASLGAAVLSAVGAGVYGGLEEALAAMTRHRRVEPEAAERARYEEAYARWRSLYATLKEMTV